MSYLFHQPYRRVTRLRTSYKQVSDAVDEWNKQSGFTGYKRGSLSLSNDGNVYWLMQAAADGQTGGLSLSGTDGSLKSCLRKIHLMAHGAIEI